MKRTAMMTMMEMCMRMCMDVRFDALSVRGQCR